MVPLSHHTEGGGIVCPPHPRWPEVADFFLLGAEVMIASLVQPPTAASFHRTFFCFFPRDL